MFNKDIIKGAVATLVMLVIGFTVGYLVGGNQSDNFAGSGTRMIHGISTDSTSPSSGEIRTTTLTVTNTASITGVINKNGLYEYTPTGTCANASTTLFDITSPAATSTIDLLSIEGTNGTSTVDIIVASSTLSSLTSTTTAGAWGIYPALFIRLNAVATSTYFCSTMGVTGEGQCSTAGSLSKARITLPPLSHIVGYATSTYSAAGATGANVNGVMGGNNSFECTYKMHFLY